MEKLVKLAVILSLLLAYFPQTRAEADVGVIFMHGKRSSLKPRTSVWQLKEKMEDTKLNAVFPKMPWHRDRFMDADFQETLKEIDGLVAKLKSDGATKIVIGGHSMGANVALAYAVIRRNVAGVVMVSPGHRPEGDNWRRSLAEDVAKAKAMVAAGKGDEEAEFGDRNQGDVGTFMMKAKIYVDFWDPEGPVIMSRNVTQLQGIPLMLTRGEKEVSQRKNRGQKTYKEMIFDKAHEHPKNLYREHDGGHRDTPESGATDIIQWIKNL